MVTRPNALSIVLAGGEGKRLMPLTADRAKPSVPFGGTYRLIDFVLSNLVNSDLRRIAVLTQYKSHSLDRHISLTWRMSVLLNNYVTSVPAQQRTGKQWFQGLSLIHISEPTRLRRISYAVFCLKKTKKPWLTTPDRLPRYKPTEEHWRMKT